jgi:hypothetical protein
LVLVAQDWQQALQVTGTLVLILFSRQLHLPVADLVLMLLTMAVLVALVAAALLALVGMVMGAQVIRRLLLHHKVTTVVMGYKVPAVVELEVAEERLLLVVMQLQRQARVAQVEMEQHPQLAECL